MSDLTAPRPVDYLEGLMEGFVAYDADWRMTYINASGERLLGRRRADVLGKTWHEAFPHAVGNAVDLMYQRVKSGGAPERMELFYEHYGRWMEISASALADGGVGVYFQDITDRKRAEEALREANAQLRDGGRRKDEFLATLAHELRNPLAPIANAVEILNLRSPADAILQSARDVIDRQVQHMVRLIDDLLDVSRITSGKLDVRCERVELAAVVERALETSRPHLGGREVTVALPARPAVFDMFSQAAPALARAGGGLGIGLALSRALVAMQGGTLGARSDGPGKGSEFIVTLPAFDDGPAPGRKQRAAAAAFRPDAILLDIGLPGMNGLDACRAIRSQPGGEGILIAALTGWGQEEDQRRSRQAGFDAHLVKPVARDALVALFSAERRPSPIPGGNRR